MDPEYFNSKLEARAERKRRHEMPPLRHPYKQPCTPYSREPELDRSRGTKLLESPQQRPPVRITYAGRRTIASSPRSTSVELPPSVAQDNRPSQASGSRDLAASDSLPDIREVLEKYEAEARQKRADHRATLDRRREAAQEAAAERQLAAIPRPDDHVMEKLGEAVEKHGECPICLWRIVGTPYTLACGHSYCGPCLKNTFETSLKESIQNIRLRVHVGHDAGDCQVVPKNATERDRLVECFVLHGQRAEDIFKYSCPLCRSTIAVAPAANVMLDLILSALNEVVRQRSSAPGDEIHRPLGTSFAGCFLGQDL